MTFGAPYWLWALLVLPILALLFVRAERKSRQRLQEFVSARLLPQLAGNVNRFRRALKFGLQLLALALALVSLAQPRVGYTFEETKRKGIDLFIAIDTSRSMLSNDVQPNRLDRVKLAAQDLINQLQGDRVGLIAFAGRAFVQAPLTIDYDAVVEAINDLDTKTIPEGGTNISEAIALADRTYGKSAMGNRALVIFTDGEELSGDAVKAAKKAADAGARIYTIGVGTPEGSLIPITSEEGGTGFVKDGKGQVVKSKLDEKRLREVAEATGGFYLHLENGTRTMQQLSHEGLGKMQAGEIDVRLSQRPIERYQWPLGGALLTLAMSILIGDRKRRRGAAQKIVRAPVTAAGVAALFLLIPCAPAFGAAPGLDAYRDGRFNDAYQEFQDTLKAHPRTDAADKLEFDLGAAAYKIKDYSKALESFSQALLSPDPGLQSKSHYNLGNTLYERGDAQKADEKKLGDWTNALQHYDETLKLDPQNQEAKENYEYVKKKIEELKKKQEEQKSSPEKKQEKNDKQNKQNQQQNKSSSKNQEQQPQNQQQRNQQGSSGQSQKQDEQEQQSQGQGESGTGQQKNDDKAQAKNEPQKNQQSKPGESPSPPPDGKGEEPRPSPAPDQEKNGDKDKQSPADDKAQTSPAPGQGENASPSPTPGEGETTGAGASPSATPEQSPRKKLAGEIKGAKGDKPEKPDQNAQVAEAELEKDGQMTEGQAEALLQSMKDEEARVQLDERRPSRRVYNDW